MNLTEVICAQMNKSNIYKEEFVVKAWFFCSHSGLHSQISICSKQTDAAQKATFLFSNICSQ